jgi:hypothetical protein
MPFHKKKLTLEELREKAKMEREISAREKEKRELSSEIKQLRFERSSIGRFVKGASATGERLGKGIVKFQKAVQPPRRQSPMRTGEKLGRSGRRIGRRTGRAVRRAEMTGERIGRRASRTGRRIGRQIRPSRKKIRKERFNDNPFMDFQL